MRPHNFDMITDSLQVQRSNVCLRWFNKCISGGTLYNCK